MTKKDLKKKLLSIRNGAFISPILEDLWGKINQTSKRIEIMKARSMGLTKFRGELLKHNLKMNDQASLHGQEDKDKRVSCD